MAEDEDSEKGLEGVMQGFLNGRPVTLVEVSQSLVESLMREGTSLTEAIKKARKSSSGKKLKDQIVKEIDDLHDSCPVDRNEFYKGVVGILLKYTGAFNAKLELNINQIPLPKEMEGCNIKKYYWKINEGPVKKRVEHTKMSYQAAEERLRKLITSAKKNNNLPDPLKEPTERVVQHTKPFGPKNYGDFYMFTTMMVPAEGEGHVGTLEIYGIPKRFVESLKRNGEDPAETLTEVLKEVADYLDTIIAGDKGRIDALLRYSSVIEKRFGTEDFTKWVEEGKQIKTIERPIKSEKEEENGISKNMGVFYKPDSKFGQMTSILEKVQESWQEKFVEDFGLPDTSKMYDADTKEVTDMITKGVIFLSKTMPTNKLAEYFPMGQATIVAMGLVGTYLFSALEKAVNIEQATTNLADRIELMQKSETYKIPKPVYSEAIRILKSMNTGGDSVKGASSKSPDLVESLAHVFSHIGKSPVDDLGGSSKNKGTIEDALTVLDMNNYSAEIVEFIQYMLMDDKSMSEMYGGGKY